MVHSKYDCHDSVPSYRTRRGRTQVSDAGNVDGDVGIEGRGGSLRGETGTGVNASRREEISAFLTERFEKSHDQDIKVMRDDGWAVSSTLRCWRCY